MFSVRQKRFIADQVQQILRSTNHPELPKEREIEFMLVIKGADQTQAWATIQNNGAIPIPEMNPHNEQLDPGT